MVGRTAKVIIYNPESNQPVAFGLEVSANKKPRNVKLLSNGVELTSWTVSPTERKILVSPPLSNDAGFQELTIVSDGDDKPVGPELASLGFKTPFSLWATRIGIAPARPTEAIANQPGTGRTR